MLQRTCTLIALPSTTGASGFSAGARWICDSRALCQHPSSRGSITSSPSHASLHVTPISQELLWRSVGMAGALGGCGTRCPSGARYMCWCVHNPRLVWDMCHLLPHSPASPDAITVLWTVLTQEGCLDVRPLPSSPPPRTQGPGTQVCPCTLYSAFTIFSLPCPSFPWGQRIVGGSPWPGSGRAVSCPLLLLGSPVRLQQDGTAVPPAQPTVWG